jgi:hypothetical protein
VGASPTFSRIPPPPAKGLVWAAAEDTVDLFDSVFAVLPFGGCSVMALFLASSVLFMEVMQSFC